MSTLTCRRMWPLLDAQGMKHDPLPSHLARAAAAALRAVDRDIEQHGAVTYETVEVVRQALAQLPR